MSVATKNPFALLDGLFFYLLFYSTLASNLFLISQLRMPLGPQALLLQKFLQLLLPTLAVIRSSGVVRLLEVESTIQEVASLPLRMAI